VTLVHRRDTLRAEKIMQDRLFKHPNVRVVWDCVVEEIVGDSDPLGVTGVKLKNIKTGEVTAYKTDCVFVAIGHDPATQLFRGQLEMDAENYIITAPDSTATSVRGVFAAGDVKDKVFRQAVTAAGMGCMAALEAERLLAEEEVEAVAAE
jgi:thioredoxin reductase (NADPH)